MDHEQNYDYEQIVNIGQEAQRLLQNQAFGVAYQEYLNDLQGRFFNTEPGHTRTLEELRREGNALAKVVGSLSKYVGRAQVAIAQAQQNPGASE